MTTSDTFTTAPKPRPEHYAEVAEAAWRSYQPCLVAQLDDPGEHFLRLGRLIDNRIQELAGGASDSLSLTSSGATARLEEAIRRAELELLWAPIHGSVEAALREWWTAERADTSVIEEQRAAAGRLLERGIIAAAEHRAICAELAADAEAESFDAWCARTATWLSHSD